MARSPSQTRKFKCGIELSGKIGASCGPRDVGRPIANASPAAHLTMLFSKMLRWRMLRPALHDAEGGILYAASMMRTLPRHSARLGPFTLSLRV